MENTETQIYVLKDDEGKEYRTDLHGVNNITNQVKVVTMHDVIKAWYCNPHYEAVKGSRGAAAFKHVVEQLGFQVEF